MRAGWENKSLKDICSVYGRIGFRGYTKADFVSSPDDGAITLSPSNIISGELRCDKCSYVSWEKYYQSPEIMIFPGDILLVKTASIGKCALVRSLPHEATINPQFVVLKEIKANHQYLTYFLQSPTAQKKFQEFAIGAAVPTFSQKKLEGLIVPVPSLPEQQRIVDILDREFAKIDALKANAEKSLQAAKDLFQTTLKKELEPKEGWKTIAIGELSLKITDGSHNPPKGIADSKYRMLSSQNVWNGYLDKSVARYLTENDFLVEDRRTCAREGDVLLTIVGTIGRTCVLTKEDENITFQRSVCIIKPKPELNPFFLCYQLQSKNEEINLQANGAAQKGFYLKQVQRLHIQLASLQEQAEIVSRLDNLNDRCKSLQDNYQKTLALCDNLKQSLLRKAFNGEL